MTMGRGQEELLGAQHEPLEAQHPPSCWAQVVSDVREKARAPSLHAEAAPLGFLPQMLSYLSGSNNSMHTQTPKTLPIP